VLKEKGVKRLEDLGMSEENIALIREAIKRPYGLILISGPTGSGKSTTLYAMLNEIDKEKNNVLSLEDPVEYNVPSISQSQVRPEIGYDFSTGLRTTLRQDPDIIMVGEIRDKETAQLAIQASLTGHLVLSTIHTNNSTGIVSRLVDMGVDPYLIPPTLILGMAQRLVRKLGPGAGRVLPINESLKLMLDKQFADLPEKYRSKIPFPQEMLALSSSPECPSGTRGREAVIEIFKMDPDIEKVILTNPVESEIYKAVRNKGMLTMKEDAIIKAFQKKIPFEEINNL
jgi:type IV pilus assembly protein PilB